MPKWKCDECEHENEIPEAIMKGCAEVKVHCDECGEEQWFDFSSYSGSDDDRGGPAAFGIINNNIKIQQQKTEKNIINRNQNRIGNGI